MRWFRLLAVLFSLAVASAAPVRAANVTDHWWSSTESGWGVSVTHQGDVAFLVMFIYDTDGKPMWVHATAHRYGYDMDRNPGFSGALHRTRGPWHGGPFETTPVLDAQVGTVFFESTGVDRATLEYTIDGVTTTKTVQRLTFRNRDWSGLYRGVMRANYRGCTPEFVPAYIYDDAFVEVEHDGAAFSMVIDGRKAVCTYTGAYTQHGRIGEASGTYACVGGPSGTFTLKGVESHERALGGRLTTSHPSCGSATIDIAGFPLLSE